MAAAAWWEPPARGVHRPSAANGCMAGPQQSQVMPKHQPMHPEWGPRAVTA